MPENTTIIYLHIPKAAGMSLNRFLEKSYPAAPHFTTHLSDVMTASKWNRCLSKITNMPASERDEYGLYKGHMYYGLHKILSKPCEYIGFMRNPEARAISHYRMMHRYKRVPAGHSIDISHPQWNLELHPAFLRSLDNYQTRILSGVDPDLPFGACNEEHLRMAKANLDSFKFVGLVEEFDLSLMLLRRTCGWGWHFYVPKNVGYHQCVKVAPDVLAAISNLNRFDFALYEHAKARFQTLAASYGWKLQVEHKTYLLGNAAHQRFDMVRRRLKKRFRSKIGQTTSKAQKLETESTVSATGAESA